MPQSSRYDINTILEIITSISSTLALEEVLTEFAQKITQLVNAGGCTIFNLQHKSESIVVLMDYVSPEVEHSEGGMSQIGAGYGLAHQPTAAQVLHTQMPAAIHGDSPDLPPGEKNLLGYWQGALLLPMIFKHRVIGLLAIFAAENQSELFENEVVVLCQALANQAAVAIENARLYHEVEDGQLIAEAMQVIGRALASELDYQRVVDNVAEFAFRMVDSHSVWVAMPKNGEFRLVAKAGQSKYGGTGFLNSMSLDLLKLSPLRRAVDEKTPVTIDDIQSDASLVSWRHEAEMSQWRSLVAVPLLAHNQLVGMLVTYASKPFAFSSKDVAILMSLASQAAIAIQNAQLFAEVDAKHQALHEVSLRLVNAQEEERRRISRELHDELGQALTALKINLDVARRLLPEDGADKLKQRVQEASTLAVQTLETARNLSLELHPAILDDLGLVAALRWELDRYEQRTGQSVQFKADLDDISLSPELEITVYRIITESLTNVARHAQADHILVQLQLMNENIVVEIIDNGVGFDAAKWFGSPQKRQSLGLVGMRERAVLLNGQLDVISKPGEGTRIRAQLPIAKRSK
jgi:signal transduction histidine kinase